MATKKAAKKSAKKAAAKKGAAKKTAAKKTAAKKATVARAAAGKCGGWSAVQDHMPPGPARLRVTGQCRFPTHGYKVALREAVPQGINPAILILDKIVTPPTGPVIKIPQTIDVKFNKKSNQKYTTVTIRPDGVNIKVKHVF
jgi:hypothetical protein